MKHWTQKSGRGPSSPQPDIEHLPANPALRHNAPFGELAEIVAANGWSIFPQSWKTKKRSPGTPRGGRQIKYKNELQLHRRLNDPAEVAWWASGSSGLIHHNVAGVTGDTAGDGLGWLTLDLDIYDRAKVEAILGIADEVFGYSPLRRGRASVAKISIILRRPAGALDVATRWVLEGEFDGKEEVVEIQDGGLPTTFFGFHHETGEFFVWADRSPFNAGPDVAPVVDEEKFIEFIRRVHALYPIRGFDRLIGGKAAIDVVDWLDTDVDDIRTPALSDEQKDAPLLGGGRRQDWLLPRSVRWATLNAGIVAPVVNGRREVSRAGVAAVAKMLAEEAKDFIKLDSDWTPSKLLAECRELIRSAAGKIVNGEMQPRGTQKKIEADDGSAVVVSTERSYPECRDPELSWLPRAKDRAKALKSVALSPADAELAAARALIGDRSAIRDRVSRKVRLAIRGWIRRVSRWNPEGKQPAPRLLIKAPTGAGKTTALIQELARFKAAGGVIGPILMLLPSYENTAELEAREDLGVWTEAQEKRAAKIIKLAGQGLKVMTFKGKIAAGCAFPDLLEQLMKKRISTAGLCQSKDEGKVVYCKHNPMNPDFDAVNVAPCQAILQKLQVPQHDLILAPHSFIQTNIPQALRDVAAVVIDEKIWDKVLGSYSFKLEETLTRPRSAPEPTKAEAKIGVTTGEYVDDRHDLADIVIPAIRQGQDVARVILDHVQHMPTGKSRGGEVLLDHARAITGRAQRVVLDIKPGMTPEAVRELCKSPNAVDIVEEHKLWSLIDERLNAIRADREAQKQHRVLMELAAAGAPKNKPDTRVLPAAPVPTAKHDRDLRIIYKAGAGDEVTVAWRKARNFADRPTLFLDASGNRQLLEKIWGGSIWSVTVKAPLHVRTVLVPDYGWSKTRLLPTADDAFNTLVQKAELLTLQREALYTVWLMHGDSAVVACAAKDVREQINTRWAAPANVHFMHYGNVRGLDFAKHHGAALSIGSVSARDTDIDAYVAALTYDDDKPEALIDPHGNGRVSPDPASALLDRPYVKRTYPLRDGGTAVVEVHEYKGAWARLLQQQIREEELAQFVGRLRPVYREGEAPVWYVLGRVLPEGTVVDDIVSIRDLARPTGRSTRIFRVVKERSGVVTEEGHGLHSKHLPAASMTAAGKLAQVFASNPRVTRGFHEVTYNVEGDGPDAEHRAWVSAAGCDASLAVARFIEVFESGISDDDRRRAGRPVLKGKPHLSRAARMKAFATPKKRHEIDERLGTLAERAAMEDVDLKALWTLDFYNHISYDDKNFGVRITGRKGCVDPDSFIAYRAWQAAFEAAAKADKEREANSSSLPASGTEDIEPLFREAFPDPETLGKPSLPVQMFFGGVPAAKAAPAPVPAAGNDAVVVPFPRRIGVRGRSTA